MATVGDAATEAQLVRALLNARRAHVRGDQEAKLGFLNRFDKLLGSTEELSEGDRVLAQTTIKTYLCPSRCLPPS